MALEKQLADTDAIYCRRPVNSNQSSIFIGNSSDPEVNGIFGEDCKSDDEVRLRLDKRNLALNAVSHLVDRKVWYKRRVSGQWSIDFDWLRTQLQTLENVFSNDQEIFIAKLNKENQPSQRLYIKSLASLDRADGTLQFALRDFLFSGDVIVLTKLDDGDVSLEVKVPNNPIIDYGNKVSSLANSENPYQVITCGAPGTGKSYSISKMAEAFDDLHKERVTFYPTYTYQQFVGTYKPSVEKDQAGNKQITYSYVRGPFLRILTAALQNPQDDFLLIIEELNRANAAAVFGDTFQLLDRNENGESEYPVAISEDMRLYFEAEDSRANNTALRDATQNYTRLFIPNNLYIWATMNSADQGVFPIDTAFKRRWDFKYHGINTDEDIIKGYKITINGETYYWNDIRKAINDRLLSSTMVNEDKLLGPFFIRLDALKDNDTLLEAFKSKVLMYLFEDAARHNRSSIFKGEKTQLTYSSICERLSASGLKAVLNIEVNTIPDNDTTTDVTETSEQ